MPVATTNASTPAWQEADRQVLAQGRLRQRAGLPGAGAARAMCCCAAPGFAPV